MRCDLCGKFRKKGEVFVLEFSDGYPEASPVYAAECTLCMSNATLKRLKLKRPKPKDSP